MMAEDLVGLLRCFPCCVCIGAMLKETVSAVCLELAPGPFVPEDWLRTSMNRCLHDMQNMAESYTKKPENP